MEHLACFAPGMVILGQRELEMAKAKEIQWMKQAEAITQACFLPYYLSATGVGRERFVFRSADPSAPVEFDPNRGDRRYLLRPEAIESVYLMWYFTGETKYREWGATMWKGIRSSCRGKFGYAILRDTNDPESQEDATESFFMAETLKYFYLLFSERETLDLSKWVLNTEAHPLIRRDRV
mmetsp:Transcript_26341/g.75515  ORF Transcript_26341/g.75515 Transcript_26341/m.75515 type:complete len:180 (+) Transcript_26341:766-1305(+)